MLSGILKQLLDINISLLVRFITDKKWGLQASICRFLSLSSTHFGFVVLFVF